MSRSRDYDRHITVFSPEGRLYQIEYAFKAVKLSGLTALAMRTGECVVGLSQKKVSDTLLDASFVSNIYTVGQHAVCLTVGLPADCRTVAFRVRQKAADFMHKNGYPIPVHVLAEELADIAQLYTQHAYMRPYGVAAMLFALDDEAGPQLFRCDPSGYFSGFKACASGPREQEAANFLEKLYRKPETEAAGTDATVENALQTLQESLRSEVQASGVEVVVCDASGVRVLTTDEVEARLNALQDRNE